MAGKDKIIVVCGPTCSGKTLVGIELAKRFGGEIISADSQQVYKGLDIGTAKPGEQERQGIEHHLIDIVEPNEQFDVSMFVSAAERAIDKIIKKGKVPIVVGGTGLYIKGLCRGLAASPPKDPAIRSELTETQEEKGTAHLYELLKKVDPASAERLKVNDKQRIIRALEVYRLTGHSITDFHKGHGFNDERYDAIKIGLNLDRNELYKRINERVDRMVKEGLEAEVRAIMLKFGMDAPALKAVGYKDIRDLNGAPLNEETVALIKQNSRNYAKRQLTWFRRDNSIKWLPPQPIDIIELIISKFLH